MKRIGLILLMAMVLAGCATTKLPPVSTDFRMEDDERRLWNRVEEEERIIDRSGALLKDEELEAYLLSVLKRLYDDSVLDRIPFRVSVLRHPECNAMAFPNGVIYIHTGLLARIENEAQLATLLGHEAAHVTHRHMVSQLRDVKNATAFQATLAVTTVGFGVIGVLPYALGTLGTMAAISGYSKDREREADREGFNRMVRAGYDPSEAVRLFVHMMKEAEEEKTKKRSFYFATHPLMQERMESFSELFAMPREGPAGTERNPERFLQKTRQVMLENTRLDLRAGRFNSAQTGTRKFLQHWPEEGEAYFILGEILRQRGEKGDVEEAKEYYRRASVHSPYLADPYRGLGLILFKEGDRELALKALEQYLNLCPDAKDRAHIERCIDQCR
jgi:beta-barrel assembly-enhancing protease